MATYQIKKEIIETVSVENGYYKVNNGVAFLNGEKCMVVSMVGEYFTMHTYSAEIYLKHETLSCQITKEVFDQELAKIYSLIAEFTKL